PEHTVFPGKAEVADALAQSLGRPHSLIQRAALQKYSKLIATEPRESVAPADLGLQQRTHLAEQSITCAMATGVVNDLELVDVEVTQCVRGLARLCALQSSLEPALEFAAVDEPREQVVACVIGQASIQLT